MDFKAIDYDSPSAISSLLDSYGFSMQKRFGQNFLVSSVFRERIVSEVDGPSDMCVWEIGPGIGSLTHLLLKRFDNVCAFEIDRGFVEILSNVFPSCRVVEGDFLKTWREEFFRSMPGFVVGNLPYNVGTVIMLDLLKAGVFVRSVFMLQREVARRVVAGVGDEFYGALSLVMSFFYERFYCFEVPSSAFWPRPKVVSSVVKLVPRSDLPVDKDDVASFVRFVFDLFSHRRKSLRNVLRSLPYFEDKVAVEIFLKSAGVDGSLRAERLEPDVVLRMWYVYRSYS